MSRSKLSITVRDRRKPCAQYHTSGHQFWVDIWNCDGTNFVYGYKLSERTHDQIEVPPGSYIIRGRARCSNVLTDLAMVNVGCEQTVCVELLPTTVRLCLLTAWAGLLFGTVKVRASEEKEIPIKEILPDDIYKNAVSGLKKAIEVLRKRTPEDTSPFEFTEEEFEENLRGLE